MATSSSPHTCSVCLEPFKDPKVLPCCHSFCKTCLERLRSETSENINCAHCRREHSIPAHGVDGFLTDFTVPSDVAASRVLRSSQESPAPCGECEGGDSAVAYCCDCESYLCDFCCHQSHKRIKRYREHRVLPLDSLSPETVKCSTSRVVCPYHTDKTPVAFCKNCEVLVCADCIVMTAHEGHKFGAIDEATRQTVAAKLTQKLAKAKTKLEDLQADLKYIKEVDNQLSQYPGELKEAINTTFDSFAAILEARRDELLKEAETTCTADLKKVWLQEETVERAVLGLETVVAFAEKVVNCSSDGEFLSLTPQVLSRLQDLQRTRWEVETVEKLEGSKLKFTAGAHEGILSSIGALKKARLPTPVVIKGLSPTLQLGQRVIFTVSSANVFFAVSRPSVMVYYGHSHKVCLPFSFSSKKAKVKTEWPFQFTAICGGPHRLTVDVAGGKVEGSPFEFTVEGVPANGARVKIGPDWSYEMNLDEHTGTVNSQSGEHKLDITWDNSRYSLRWGEDGRYDVMLAQ